MLKNIWSKYKKIIISSVVAPIIVLILGFLGNTMYSMHNDLIYIKKEIKSSRELYDNHHEYNELQNQAQWESLRNNMLYSQNTKTKSDTLMIIQKELILPYILHQSSINNPQKGPIESIFSLLENKENRNNINSQDVLNKVDSIDKKNDHSGDTGNFKRYYMEKVQKQK